MADISKELQQLMEAKYGEEVRGAFASCMKKINQVSEDVENGEKIRVEAESKRKEAEENRVVAETSRAESEESRRSDELSRDRAEESRKNAEASRIEAEEARCRNETSRENAETTRVSAENIRKQNEEKRQVDTADAISKAEEVTQLLINQVNTIAFQINSNDKGLDAIILTNEGGN